ncbi:hypothetical protein MMC06_003529 [Schaereria dolodes]|nr:hypothetical protein [Schaereria dolodes]
MRASLLVVAGCAALVSAWMPIHKNLFNAPGALNFQNSTANSTANSTTNSWPRGRSSRRWLPATNKIKGVNLGSMFILEPWMAEDEWNTMGCSGTNSEFDCVMRLGQEAANSAFQAHWARWITQADIQQMQSYGLNTIRIPLGYWIREDIVYSDSEHFPQGGLQYLEQVVGWASDAGFYIILDLHGAPGAQFASTPGFYVDYQYERAYKFLEWMTNIIHTNNAYRNVGMLEVVNEPVQNPSTVATMLQDYYPTAWSRIRAAEAALNVGSNNLLHIQMMNQDWGSGSPSQYLSDQYFAAYDDHRYIKWAYPPVAENPAAYLSTSCNDDRGGNTPTIVGEWSLSVADDVQWSAEFDPTANVAWYKQWWAAQVMAYEKQEGWIFWSWKTELGDYRWGYKDAVAAGVIPTDPGQAYNLGACNGI